MSYKCPFIDGIQGVGAEEGPAMPRRAEALGRCEEYITASSLGSPGAFKFEDIPSRALPSRVRQTWVIGQGDRARAWRAAALQNTAKMQLRWFRTDAVMG